MDRVRKQVGNGHNFNLVARRFRRQWNCVGNDQTLDRRIFDTPDSVTRQYGMDGCSFDPNSPVCANKSRGFDHGATTGDLIVNDESIFALDVADQGDGFCVLRIIHSPFINDGDWVVQSIGVVA